MTEAEYDQVEKKVLTAMRWRVVGKKLKITTNITDETEMGAKVIGFVNGANDLADKLIADIDMLLKGENPNDDGIPTTNG